MKLNRALLGVLLNGLKLATKGITSESVTSKGITHNGVSQLLADARFVPDDIRKYIHTNGEYRLVYRATVHGRDVTIYITSFKTDDGDDEPPYDEWAVRMLNWLHIGYQHADCECAPTLAIHLYPTPFEKRLPSSVHETVGPPHVNSGVAWRCEQFGEIAIYRKEEWFKVFVHETFHALGLDLDPHQVGLVRSDLRRHFPVASDFNLAEAYTETWARIINAAFVSFDRSTGSVGFSNQMVKNLTSERDHSLRQMHKLLDFIGVPYTLLLGKTPNDSLKRQSYREGSNVLAYYVLGGILMNDPNGFMEWCADANKTLINFDASDEAAKRFGAYVVERSAERLLFAPPPLSPHAKRSPSTRMTILQIN